MSIGPWEAIMRIVDRLLDRPAYAYAQPSSLPAAVNPVALAASAPISVTLAREDAPKFKRKYTAALPAGGKIEIEIRNGWRGNGTYRTGTLTQRDGKWILFDPYAVADKIIDRDLRPIVESLTSQILLADAQFRQTPPVSFIDENGAAWRRP